MQVFHRIYSNFRLGTDCFYLMQDYYYEFENNRKIKNLIFPVESELTINVSVLFE